MIIIIVRYSRSIERNDYPTDTRDNSETVEKKNGKTGDTFNRKPLIKFLRPPPPVINENIRDNTL